MVRQYAAVVGVVLLLLGIVGLIINLASPSTKYLLNFLNIELVENIIYIVTGGLLAYVGLAQNNASVARMVVIVLSAIYLLVGIVGLFSNTVFGLIPSGYIWGDNVLHLALGIIGLGIAVLMPRNTSATVRM